jgi:hypothetical protein
MRSEGEKFPVRRRIATTCCLGSLVGMLTAAPALGQPPVPETFTAPGAASFWEPFTEIPGDVKAFVSKDTLKILAPAAVGALFGSQFDREGIDMSLARLQPAAAFKAGNIGGGFFAQTGGAFAVYTLGHLTKSETVRVLGGDLSPSCRCRPPSTPCDARVRMGATVCRCHRGTPQAPLQPPPFCSGTLAGRWASLLMRPAGTSRRHAWPRTNITSAT